MPGQVVAVASGKGGVGKTTTVVNLGVVLRRADHSVVLVDADLGMANLGPMLGVTAEHTLHDVLAGTVTVEEAVVEEAPGFGVLTGSSDLADFPDAAPEGLGEVLETLAESYDFVLVDTGAGMSHEDVLPLGLADQVVLVATPDPAAIGDTRKTAELAKLAEGTVAGLLVTKAEADTDVKHVADEVGVALLGVVPYDATVRRSTAAGQPLEAVDPDSPAAAAYRDLADSIADGSTDPLQGTPSAEALGDGPSPDTDPEVPSPEVAPDAASSEGADERPEASSGAATETVDDEPPAPDEATREPASDNVDGSVDEPDTAVDAAEEPEEPDSADSADEIGGDAEDVEADDERDADTEDTEEDEEGAEDAEDTEEDEERDADTGDTEEGDQDPEEAESDEEVGEDDEDAEADDENGEDTKDADSDDAEDDEEDYLAEWEDDEPERSGGLLSRIGRLFR